MIPRLLAPILLIATGKSPVVTVTGPRQSGKTTLVRATLPDFAYANLENPELRALARQDPKSFLARFPAPAIFDEIQRVPELLSWIQVAVDERPGNGRYVLSGSNQPELGHAVSQSLAGRTTLLTLLPLSLEELAAAGRPLSRDEALVKGFLPRVHAENQEPHQAYLDYLATYVERDLRQLLRVKDLAKFELFLRLLAGRAGQILNLHALSGEVGASSTTLAEWLSILEASFIVRRLQPWYANLGKRLVKSPKLYFLEPGLLAALLQIETKEQAARDPLLGAIFENLVVVELMKGLHNRARHDPLSFYRDAKGNEVDLVLERARVPTPIEIKASRTFTAEQLRGLRYFAGLVPEAAPGWLVLGEDPGSSIDGIGLAGFGSAAARILGS